MLTSRKTTAAIKIFLLCIMLHPEVQQRVHEELDRVVGSEHLPTYEDRTSLAYFHAAWKEASRWRPVAPYGTKRIIIWIKLSHIYICKLFPMSPRKIKYAMAIGYQRDL